MLTSQVFIKIGTVQKSNRSLLFIQKMNKMSQNWRRVLMNMKDGAPLDLDDIVKECTELEKNQRQDFAFVLTRSTRYHFSKNGFL